jgi:hypothetical protein
MYNFSDAIENRADDPPAFSAVSQPTAPPPTGIVIKQEFLNYNQGYPPSTGKAHLPDNTFSCAK